jgi:hypothetical protein
MTNENGSPATLITLQGCWFQIIAAARVWWILIYWTLPPT